ncbi:acetyl-CoA synthetase [Hydrogenoanaerobacterium saccharovorans]|uniref:Acetyl-CoA synthetase n=2 Tax=Hydrogenoanaerobacterium saccharovorans TaxID=474960 RepID=A0A1H7ZPA7_9FIRM|nr:acetyl-CoA synthetase [Hydrogenoanaerobacterium saccharovorans]SEM60230.1 acetyl-CoA synthetase [Hydrogenoanaerobacterium saccharovorans]
MDMENFYERFCDEKFTKRGVLCDFTLKYSENYNFAYDVMDEIARLQPNRRAMIWCNEAGEEHTFSFSDLKRMSDKTANMLRTHGVKKGDMVMLVLKRHFEFWFSILALHKLGAVAIPATNLLTKKDFEYRFEAAGVKAVLCTADGEVAEHVDMACEEYKGLSSKIIVNGKRDGWYSFTDEVEKASENFERVETKAHEPMLLYFTSGTTGYPKMVIHDHTYSLGHIITAKYWHNVDPDGIHLSISDTGWGKAAWGKLYGQWICGTTVFVYDFDKFVPGDILAKIEKYRITTFCAPPTMYRFFIKEGMDGYDLSCLKYATTAGEALNPEVYNRFLEYTGLKLMEGFGQTETTLVLTNLVGTTPKVGSMGKPSPMYHVDLVDEDGNSVEPGVTGEIVIRTQDSVKQPGLFMGYYRNEKLTNEAWHDNLYHTGDTAWRDEDGFFWYVGRTDDVIKASGYRIGPFEIESVLMEHPAVLECAVTGAPDPVRGQVVKATIVLTKAYKPSTELIKELQSYVKKQTAPYKYPRIVEFVEELPKTISGKIKRVDIRNNDNK